MNFQRIILLGPDLTHMEYIWEEIAIMEPYPMQDVL